MNTEAVWRAMANPARRRLVEMLRDGPRTTGQLCRAFSTSRFAVMKQLAVLERCGVISVRRSGRERWNVLDPEPLRSLGGQVPGEAAGPVSIQSYVDAPPWRVFDALTVNVAAWWGAPYLGGADASNLFVEAQPGGRFVEEWGHRQGRLRGVVTAIRQDERLELTGAVLGPAEAALDIRLEKREGGTLLTAAVSRARTAADEGEPDRGALQDLFGVRLKAFVEHGTRSGVAG
jgi:DNA-binding transcriptional ArsR family regulator